MDAIFGVLFLLYMAAMVIAAISKVRQGRGRSAGAPWPSVPPLRAPGTGGEVPGSPASAPAQPAQDEVGGPEIQLEPVTRPHDVPVARPALHPRPTTGEPGRQGALRTSVRPGQSREGISLEWDDVQDWTAGGQGARRPAAHAHAVRRPAGARERPGRRAAPSEAAASLIGRLDGPELARAVVLAEVLGPPLALRRRRRRQDHL